MKDDTKPLPPSQPRGRLDTPRQRRAPPPLRRDMPAITLTLSPSLARVIHWRVHARDYAEQTELVAIVEKLLEVLDATEAA